MMLAIPLMLSSAPWQQPRRELHLLARRASGYMIVGGGLLVLIVSRSRPRKRPGAKSCTRQHRALRRGGPVMVGRQKSTGDLQKDRIHELAVLNNAKGFQSPRS